MVLLIGFSFSICSKSVFGALNLIYQPKMDGIFHFLFSFYDLLVHLGHRFVHRFFIFNLLKKSVFGGQVE